jgi:prepilin-type N-terminal cleavage/methylation domain-containing protein
MRNAKGFTLVELLIVILIITILATILIPNFTAFRKRAYDAVVVSYLSDVAKFEEIYLIDNNSYTANLNNLYPLGLKPVPSGVMIGFRNSSHGYCFVAAHPRGTVWFVVTPSNGVYKTNSAANGGAPSNCPDPL